MRLIKYISVFIFLCSVASAQQITNPGRSVVIYNPGSSRAVNPQIITEIISWNSPTQRTDGTAVGANDIQGYTLYWGMASRTYSGSYDFNKTDLALNLLFLQPGTYYLSVAARDSNGPSGYSDEIVKVIDSQVPTNYSVTPSASLGGTITPNTPQTIASGGYVPFTVTPDTGYVYSGFTVTGSSAVYSGGTITVGPVTQNATLLASFETQTFTVAGAVSGGNGSISPTSQVVTYGDTVVFTATPNSNYHVADMTGCSGIFSGQTLTTGLIASNCTVTATFAADVVSTPISWDAVTQCTDNSSCSPDYYLLSWYSGSSCSTLVGSLDVGTALTYDAANLNISGTYSFTVTAKKSGLLDGVSSCLTGVVL